MSSSINNNIPLDIWGEILVRLPGESLIRARAVSKVFRAVIDDPCFVRAHTNKQQQHQLSSSNIIIQSFDSSYSVDLEALTIQDITTPLDLNFLRDRYCVCCDHVAACNGLILTEKPADLTIWNPLTREQLLLPRTGFRKKVRAIGLGYDCATDDYKAVAILSNRETHIYSLKQDTWRKSVNCPAPCDGDLWGPDHSPGVFVGGALFWLLTTVVGVVALDIGTEKFSMLQMPRKRNHNKHNKLLLNVLGGCIALSDSGYNSHLDVWVMKKDNRDEEEDSSWIKVFSIEYERNISVWSGILRPTVFIMKEKLVVFLQDSNGKFFLFDVENKSLKCMNFPRGQWYKFSFWYPKQMLVGTIFRLHASCGGGGGGGIKIATTT